MRTNFITTALLFSLVQLSAIAQTELPDPDSILIGDKNIPKVLLVGSFHFAYYNLDAHVTEEKDQVKVLSPQRQKEMKDLVEYISRYKPTKIVVESGRNTGYLMHNYRAYQSGQHPLESDEIEQIGFRLLEKFGLDTLYGCDDGTLAWDLYDHKDSLIMHPILDSLYEDWDFRSQDPMSLAYSQLYDFSDKYALGHSLLEKFKFMNSVKMYERGYGAYLCGDFTLGDTRGADALAMHWYSRNLRIFRHIQQLNAKPDDRILVLFGAGHMGILYQLFKSSPEFHLVDFDVLNGR